MLYTKHHPINKYFTEYAEIKPSLFALLWHILTDGRNHYNILMQASVSHILVKHNNDIINIRLKNGVREIFCIFVLYHRVWNNTIPSIHDALWTVNICYPVQLAAIFSRRIYLTAMVLDPISIYRISSTCERCILTHVQYQSVCSFSYSFMVTVEQRNRNCQLKGSLSKRGRIEKDSFSIVEYTYELTLVRHWVPRIFQGVVFHVD